MRMKKIILETGVQEQNIIMNVMMLDILCRLLQGDPQHSNIASLLNVDLTDPNGSAVKD